MTEVLATRFAQQLDLFAGAMHDYVAQHDGRDARWERVRKETRVRWREAIKRSIESVNASRLSRLGHELPDPPEPLGVMAYALENQLDSGRSRATTRAGQRRTRSRDGMRLTVLWPAAIGRGLAALQATRGEAIEISGPQLLQRLPALASGAAELHPDEAPY